MCSGRPPVALKVECYGATRPQDGGSANEDAFVIGHGPIKFAALCDGAGHAEQVARRALKLFQTFFKEAPPESVLADATWAKWVRLLDSALLGGPQSTFVGVAVVGNEVVGASAGDSRCYVLDADGGCRIVTDSRSKARLGSGKVEPMPIWVTLRSRDILLLLSDGAWTPLSLYLLKRAVRSVALKHFSEVPQAVLDAAGRSGRADDMTTVALRVIR